MIHNIPQPEFEHFVARRLAYDPNSEVRRGVGFVSCEQVSKCNFKLKLGSDVLTVSLVVRRQSRHNSRGTCDQDKVANQITICHCMRWREEPGSRVFGDSIGWRNRLYVCPWLSIERIPLILMIVETMMTIHFKADLKPVVGDRLGMLHWILDPACSGFIISYDVSGNQVLISNFDVSWVDRSVKTSADQARLHNIQPRVGPKISLARRSSQLSVRK